MIEEKVDRDYLPRLNRTLSRYKGPNPFFPFVGDMITSSEQKLTKKMMALGSNDDGDDENIMFCLPCDVRDEVYAKPPSYRHVQSLQYDKNNRPPKAPLSNTGVCQCVTVCDENCINRMCYVECYGDGSNPEKSNCLVGPECGNRQVTKRKFAKCKPMREQGRGWGLVTVEKVTKGNLVMEYVGEVIDAKTKESRLVEWAKEHPNDPNFYIMELTRGWFIDAREVANLSRFINHSCDPNSILLPVNVGGYMRNAIIALRDIAPGEFLSYDYHFDTKQGDRFLCRCGAATCRGTMKGGKTKNDTHSGGDSKSAAEKWTDAKNQLARDKQLVLDYGAHQEALNSIHETIPGCDNPEELVANGPQQRNRAKVQQQGIFLWRNVIKGANFASRMKPNWP